MKNSEVNTNNPVESTTSVKMATVHSLFKFTVTHSSLGDDAFISDKWSAVVNFLLEDDQVRNFGERDYNENREGRWNDDECEAFIEKHIREYAAEAGYTITERTES